MPSKTELEDAIKANRNADDELRPYQSGVCMDFARILCSRLPEAIKNVMGLHAVESIPQSRIDVVAGDKLGRGNKGTSRRANTNRSYWPRQLSYLEFVDENPQFKVSLEEFADELGMTVEAASGLTNWTTGKISLANAKGAVAYLDNKQSEREAVVSEKVQM